MFPRAFIGFHQIDLYRPTHKIIENSHCFRVAIPLPVFGEVWSVYNGRMEYGRKWWFCTIRFTDIITGADTGSPKHIWEFSPHCYIDLYRV